MKSIFSEYKNKNNITGAKYLTLRIDKKKSSLINAAP